WLSGNASRSSTRFADFAKNAAGDGAGGGLLADVAALPAEQRVEVLSLVLAEQVADVLGMSADDVDTNTPLPELGLDSLSAVELSARLAARLNVRQPATNLSRLSGLSAIAKQILADQDVP